MTKGAIGGRPYVTLSVARQYTLAASLTGPLWLLHRWSARAMRTQQCPGLMPLFAAILVVWFGAIGPAYGLSCATTNFTGNFGAVNLLSGASVPAIATFTVTCSGNPNQSVRFCLDIGPGPSPGPSGQRALRSSSTYLYVEYYTTSGHSVVWGSWGLNGSYPTSSPAGFQQDETLNSSGTTGFTFTVYALISANQQTTPPGTYSWTSSDPTVQYNTTGTTCPSGGSAGTSGSSFTATINANCTVSATSLVFAQSPTVITANVDSTATIAATCTSTTPYSIGLGSGLNANGSQNRMQLGATGVYLNYGLYTDSARSHDWTTTTSTTSCTLGTSTCALGTGTGTEQDVTVYGRVPPQTAGGSGLFTDSVVVTITF